MLGFGSEQQFPVYADRFPIQLLAYLRLSRIQDPAMFAKVCGGWNQWPGGSAPLPPPPPLACARFSWPQQQQAPRLQS